MPAGPSTTRSSWPNCRSSSRPPRLLWCPELFEIGSEQSSLREADASSDGTNPWSEEDWANHEAERCIHDGQYYWQELGDASHLQSTKAKDMGLAEFDHEKSANGGSIPHPMPTTTTTKTTTNYKMQSLDAAWLVFKVISALRVQPPCLARI